MKVPTSAETTELLYWLTLRGNNPSTKQIIPCYRNGSEDRWKATDGIQGKVTLLNVILRRNFLSPIVLSRSEN